MNLCVMMSVRDRIILTEKCIESLQDTKGPFNKIEIYAFDNYSDLNNERFTFFSNMLNKKYISYYSYDTKESLVNCFGKAQAHYRFIHMMEARNELLQSPNKIPETFYAIIDNDMIFNGNWAEMFITATKFLEHDENIFYITKNRKVIDENIKEEHRVKSLFSDKEFIVGKSRVCGGSAFWFFNYNMLLKVKYNTKDLINCKNINKKHDSTVWKNIKKATNSGVIGTGIVKIPEPHILHLGVPKIFGSICRSDMVKKYNGEKYLYEKSHRTLEKLSHQEIYEKFKDDSTFNNW